MDHLSLCPSFNSYSSSAHLANDAVLRASRDRETHEDDFDFEFVSNPDLESLDGGEIRRMFPVFNRDLLSDHRREAAKATAAEEEEDGSEEPILIPLRKLFLDDDDRDRDPPSSSSSSEADELESVAPGTYCVWTPKPAAPSRCEKSSSTGSSATAKQSRRWRLRDLLRRSNSEGAGKDSAALVFLGKEKLGAKSAGKSKPKIPAAGEKKAKISAAEKFYVRNRKLKEEDKRRSYLPYRQGLVGFFGHNSNGNGMGTAARTFPPF